MIIYKYELSLYSETHIEVPENHEVLKVDTIRDVPVVWIALDEKAEKNSIVKFAIETTGNEYKPIVGLKYPDTFLIYGEAYVGHVFYYNY